MSSMTSVRDIASRLPVSNLALATRVAVAAVLAWTLVLPFGGLADEYPYYAPLGAVVAVSTTVMSSLRTSLEVFLALVAGAALAVGVHALDLPSPVAVGLVVGVGSMVAGLPWLRTMGSWTPIAGLFVLILGGEHPSEFVLGYLGFTMLGALVGSVVNLAFPPLLLTQTRQAQESLRDYLVEHLSQLAHAMDHAVLPEHGRLAVAHDALRSRSRKTEDVVAQALEGPPVNWRVHRWRTEARRLRDQGRALVALSLVVTEMSDTLANQVPRESARAPWRNVLAAPTAELLRAVADVLASVEGSTARPETLEGARDAAHRLDRAARSEPAMESADLFTAGALVVGVRRMLDTLDSREE